MDALPGFLRVAMRADRSRRGVRLCPPLHGLFVAVVVAVSGSRGASAQEEFAGRQLESAVSQAHLVMVARVVSISRVTVVEGAKTDVALREFRFQPVRKLKGLFQRDQLSMTASDLGIPAEDLTAGVPLKEGEYRLLILVQPRGLTSYGCVSAGPGVTFDERVPLLKGPDDPLLSVVETLIRVADSRSRREKAALLIERLAEPGGPSAPLLTSLQLRADWAAADGRMYEPGKPTPAASGDPGPGLITALIQSQSPAVRGAAVPLLRDMLATRIRPKDPQRLDEAATALRASLASDNGDTEMRLAATEALGRLIGMGVQVNESRDLLVAQLTGAATHAERAAAAAALAEADDLQSAAAVLDALRRLPLDEPAARETVYARAALRIAAGAESVLWDRLERSMAARQSLEAEILAIGHLKNEDDARLVGIARRPDLSEEDRQHLARAFRRVGDDRAVPVLVGWLQNGDYQLKEIALAALEQIDSDAAARDVRPLLKTEPHLPFKLRLAHLLARHGLDDGYSLATEHAADEDHTAAAALVLVALDDPRTKTELSAILAARPDRRWHAGALTGLVAVGDEAARAQLLEILADDRHPLAAEAAAAVGLTDDAELLPPLAALVQSRNRQVALASLLALRRFLSGVRSSPRGLAAIDPEATAFGDDQSLRPAVNVPDQTSAALLGAIAPLVTDPYVEPDARREALRVARLLAGAPGSPTYGGYVALLDELADQAELEVTPLLAEVQAERRRLRGAR